MLKPGGYYSVMTAGPSEGMKASVLDAGSSSMPTPDVCQARFINATSDLTIDVTVRGARPTPAREVGSLRIGQRRATCHGCPPLCPSRFWARRFF
jgi:hypothetical protein